MRITPDKITRLEPNEIFVFGANEAGIHGAGAAKFAIQFGALRGTYGRMRRTYGIPTKDSSIKTLPLPEIAAHVQRFLRHTGENRTEVFLVTQIGCGLAGYTPKEIAPMFVGASDNVALPREFWEVITPTEAAST